MPPNNAGYSCGRFAVSCLGDVPTKNSLAAETLSARKVRTTIRKVTCGWLVALLGTSGWVLVPGLTPFGVMCGISLTLFVVIKLHVLANYKKTNGRPVLNDVVAWFGAWPGLDARAFFRTQVVDRPRTREWLFAVAKTCFGGWMLLWVAVVMLATGELVAGWAALIGIVFLLHFGIFHLAALFWRFHGRDVKPIMNSPILATSVADFWSRRWNLAFRDYASPFLFVPLMRRTNPAASVLVGYTFSGLVHELAISVPAQAGYGLPTFYFLIQGLAMLMERAAEKRGVQLTTGFQGRVWTAIVSLPAAYLLFHPPFIRAVVVPVVKFFVQAN